MTKDLEGNIMSINVEDIEIENSKTLKSFNAEMTVVKCENGHFFDVNAYNKCPFCGARECKNITEKPAEKKKGLFKFLKKDEKKVVGNTKSSTSPKSVNNHNKYDDVFEEFSSDNKNTPDKDLHDEVYVSKPEIKSISSIPDDTPTGGYVEVNIENNVQKEEKSVQISSNLLNEEVRRVSANQGDKTMGFFSMNLADSKKPINNSNPVVGWLVCIEGDHIGESFNIYSGRNSVGRNEKNKVVLNKDLAVSRDKHCWVIFDPKKSQFLVQQGESDELTYLNDEGVYGVKELRKNDKIQIGGTTLLFIPLCDDVFKWDDFINKV